VPYHPFTLSVSAIGNLLLLPETLDRKSNMNEPAVKVIHDHLPFYITGPGESDILFTAVTISLIAIVVGFGALYFTIQAIPDRIAKGTSKAQMQLVGLLGLISLFTMNNLYWVAAILLAAVRIPNIMAPLTDIASSLRSRAGGGIGSRDSEIGELRETTEVSNGLTAVDETRADPSAKREPTGND
jgi:hypothetical protein